MAWYWWVALWAACGVATVPAILLLEMLITLARGPEYIGWMREQSKRMEEDDEPPAVPHYIMLLVGWPAIWLAWLYNGVRGNTLIEGIVEMEESIEEEAAELAAHADQALLKALADDPEPSALDKQMRQLVQQTHQSRQDTVAEVAAQVLVTGVTRWVHFPPPKTTWVDGSLKVVQQARVLTQGPEDGNPRHAGDWFEVDTKAALALMETLAPITGGP